MIIYRLYFEEIGVTDKWWHDYSQLTDEEKSIINPIIESNNFNDVGSKTTNINVLNVLQYYRITREDAEKELSKK